MQSPIGARLIYTLPHQHGGRLGVAGALAQLVGALKREFKFTSTADLHPAKDQINFDSMSYDCVL